MFDEVKERLIQQVKQIIESVQENSTYLRLKDQFDNLSPALQKISTIIVSIILVGIIFYMPYSYFDSSQNNISEFDKQRSLIRELLKVHRESSEAPNIPLAPSLQEIESRVQQILSSAALKPEQIKSVQQSSSNSNLIPNNLSAGAVNISLSLINLEQLIDLGYQMENINPSLKMTGLDIQPSIADKRYFDVNFSLVALAIPEVPHQTFEEEPKEKFKSKRERK